MPLIKGNKIVADAWHVHADESVPKQDYCIIDLACWQENKASLISQKLTFGLTLEGDADMTNVTDDLQHFALIAINFPSFVDGRGYSLAKNLRQKYGYTQDIRAVGDILPDQALYLTRVGFSSLFLANEKNALLALEKLAEHNVFYQPQTV
ncbi:MAG: oxidoreductase [Cycloclasticus sp. symbiont of Poecilosclerida sp. N]|nr:MAG: oxidoreductase [Cycloclasticus sp. symbiont of Poecilosclerida sp. N]